MGHACRSFGGVFPAICTTFSADGALDLDAQRGLCVSCSPAGADGIVCFGLAGEVNKLTPEDRKRLTSTIIEEVDGRVPVLVGAGAEAVHTSLELARHAEAEVPPALSSPLRSPPISARPAFGLISGHRRSRSTCPVVIQDAPAYLGINFSAKGIRKPR